MIGAYKKYKIEIEASPAAERLSRMCKTWHSCGEEPATMIPLGYMLKHVVPPPDWLAAALKESGVTVDRVYSACSCCTSTDFADYDPDWKHNGWWLFDGPDTLAATAIVEGADPAALTLFYYEGFGEEYDEANAAWRPVAPEPFATNVQVPRTKALQGYDVVTFWAGHLPESSPLSCCAHAAKVPVNRFCLFDSFEAAHAYAQSPLCAGGEPGPYRVIAVYTLD